MTPAFLAAAALVQGTDAYTIVPARLVAAVGDAFGLRRLSIVGPPAKITIAQAWSPRFDNDAGHTWFRGCVRRACARAERTDR